MADENAANVEAVDSSAGVPDAATGGAVDTAPVVEKEEPHPLEPGGKRFEQVYARMKAAEEAKQREREARIAAEAKLETLKDVRVAPGKDQPKEFTWAELETAIERGQLTRAEALDYREKQIIRQTKAEVTREILQQTDERERFSKVNGELLRYMNISPDLTNMSSALREKVEREYMWLVGVHGSPQGDLNKRAMELTAVKNVLGPVDMLERKRESDRLTRENRETAMESNETASRVSTTVTVDESKPPKGLTPEQLAHYEKMFVKTNAYPNGWKDVRKELAWQKPSLVRRGR